MLIFIFVDLWCLGLNLIELRFLDQSTNSHLKLQPIFLKFTTCMYWTSSWSINQSVCVPELRWILDKSTTPSPLKSSSPKKSWSQMATRSLVSAMRDWSSWKENISLNTGLSVLDLYAVFFCPSPFLQEKEIYNNYLHVLVWVCWDVTPQWTSVLCCHPVGTYLEMLLVTLCYRNWDKLQWYTNMAKCRHFVIKYSDWLILDTRPSFVIKRYSLFLVLSLDNQQGRKWKLSPGPIARSK